MTRLFCHVIVILLYITNVHAQPYYFRHYQVENGLSNNSVYFIKQDSNGFMWFATKDGLNRFDGFHFKVFRINSAEDDKHLSTDYIFCILPGEDGMLWVGAQRGLYMFNRQKERLEPFIDSLPNIFDITVDHLGQYCFIYLSTSSSIIFKTITFSHFLRSNYLMQPSFSLQINAHYWTPTNMAF